MFKVLQAHIQLNFVEFMTVTSLFILTEEELINTRLNSHSDGKEKF